MTLLCSNQTTNTTCLPWQQQTENSNLTAVTMETNIVTTIITNILSSTIATENITTTSTTTDITTTMTIITTTINTDPDTDFQFPSPVASIIVGVLMWFISLLGNMLVCIVIHRSKRLQSTTNYFVLSLASADHVFTLLVLPFIFAELSHDGEWTLGDVACRLVRTMLHWTPGITMLILVCIAFDRYYTILYPLCFKVTRARAKHMIICSWLTALLISLPALYFYKMDTGVDSGMPPDKYCMGFVDSGPYPDRVSGVVYTIIYVVLLYVIPAAAVVVLYLKVFRYIWRVGTGGRTFQRTTNPVPRTKVKMVKLIMVVNVVILVLVSPYFIAHLWHCSTEHDSRHSYVFLVVVYTYAVSVCAKPVLYLCYNSNFRRGCREVFCTSTMRCYRKNIYTVTTSSKMARQNHVGIMQNDGSIFPRIPTPSKTFNRAQNMEKGNWPLGNSAPATYL